MIEALFWVVLRSVAIPYIAFLILKDTFLGEEGALLAIGIALLIVTIISITLNAIKIIGNILLLRGEKVIILILKIAIQVLVVLFIWIHYFSQYSDLLN